MHDNEMKYYEVRRKILFDLFDKFPDLGDRGIARILYRDHPEFFTDYEHARAMVRCYRGHSGDTMRKDMKKSNKYYKDVQPTS